MATDPTEKDKRPYFVLTNEYPGNRKIRRLSDKAFRLHVSLIALCNGDLSDGIIEKHDFEQLGPRPAKELLTAAPGRNPLAYALPDGTFRLHDYLRHQNDAIEVQGRMSERAESGRRGGLLSAHKRNHVNKGIRDPNCLHCPGEEPPPEDSWQP